MSGWVRGAAPSHAHLSALKFRHVSTRASDDDDGYALFSFFLFLKLVTLWEQRETTMTDLVSFGVWETSGLVFFVFLMLRGPPPTQQPPPHPPGGIWRCNPLMTCRTEGVGMKRAAFLCFSGTPSAHTQKWREWGGGRGAKRPLASRLIGVRHRQIYSDSSGLNCFSSAPPCFTGLLRLWWTKQRINQFTCKFLHGSLESISDIVWGIPRVL